MPSASRPRACSSLRHATTRLAHEPTVFPAGVTSRAVSHRLLREASPRVFSPPRSARAGDWSLRFLFFARSEPLLDVRDQLTCWRAGAQQSSDAAGFERFDVFLRNDAATRNEEVVPSLQANEF